MSFPIVLSSSDYFVPYLYITLLSLIEHSSIENSYEINILESDLSEKSKKRITELQKNNIKINFINVSEQISNKNFFAHDHVAEQTFYKLLIPSLFKNYEKILFLDADIIIQDDIAKIFEIKMNDKKIAATWCILWNGIINNDKKAYDYTVNKLGLHKPDNYFQCGVLLYNNKYITDSDVTNLINLATKESYQCLDQDVLNSYFKNDIVFFSNEWNYETPQNGFYKISIPFIEKNKKENWIKASKAPKIIHFSGKEKPWLYPDEEYADIWWKYARKSPFYEQILHNMIVYSEKKYAKQNFSAIKNYKKNCINYWICKILKNFTFKKLRKHYIEKALRLKCQIRRAKELQK